MNLSSLFKLGNIIKKTTLILSFIILFSTLPPVVFSDTNQTINSIGINNGQIPNVSMMESCYYLKSYLRKDFNNDELEVKKLQTFLREHEGFDLIVNGVYDDSTIRAVDSFQIKYKDEILTPWGYDGTFGTGYTYILTKKKINEIYCQKNFPLTVEQQKEINSFRMFLLNTKKTDVNTNKNVVISKNLETTGVEQQPIMLKDDVAIKDTGIDGVNLSTLAGVSSTTEGITDGLTSDLMSSRKDLANIITSKSSLSVWLNLILVIVIIVISYFWYRERRNNKKIDDVNKEIDLN